MTSKKVALITGVTGQDGSYLAECLLEKGYEVHGVKRRNSLLNTSRIDHLYQEPQETPRDFILHYGDMTDGHSLTRVLQDIQPSEVYNLAAQSHVAVSFEQPEYTANVDALGTLRLLEGIRLLGLADKTRFYQASTSELYGGIYSEPQSESTPFYPKSPYGVAKLFGFWSVVNYRESFGLYACNGILFNHESPRRGETFVTRKITRGLARVCAGLEKCLFLGNLDASRDWGHAKDYVQAQWLMLQQESPKDYVIATGQQTTVREFVSMCASAVGLKIEFRGEGEKEIGVVIAIANPQKYQLKEGDVLVRIDPNYFRPSEVETLCGDPTQAQSDLNWRPEYDLKMLCEEMIAHDFAMVGL